MKPFAQSIRIGNRAGDAANEQFGVLHVLKPPPRTLSHRHKSESLSEWAQKCRCERLVLRDPTFK